VPYQEPLVPQPIAQQPVYDVGAPVAGRVPAAMPELPSAGPSSWHQPSAEQPTWTQQPAIQQESYPQSSAAVQIPRQRADEDYRYNSAAPQLESPAAAVPVTERPAGGSAPLRRRVPGSQLPAESGPTLPSAPPSQDDAVAARAAFDDFEAGVSRAQWDVVETDMSSPPSAGHAPLARRVPGATLPRDEPHSPPPLAPAPPLDPDAARALMEQFEYGVALALSETQPQPEGQPR
jgi:hypothetical protein